MNSKGLKAALLSRLQKVINEEKEKEEQEAAAVAAAQAADEAMEEAIEIDIAVSDEIEKVCMFFCVWKGYH